MSVSPVTAFAPDSRHRLLAVLTGLAAGASGGLFGVGGGVVMIPLLTGALGLTQHQAHGTSLAVIGITALVSIVVYALHGNVAWLAAALIGPASFFAARWGARLAARTSSLSLARAFAILVLLVGVRMLFLGGGTGATFAAPPALWFCELGLGLAAGVLAGFMGVGGGILIVPALTLLIGMPQQIAQGTSLAVILLAAPGGALEHHRKGNLVSPLVPWLALGAVVGAPLTALVAQQLPREILTRGFALFMIVNGVWGWFRAGAKHRK